MKKAISLFLALALLGASVSFAQDVTPAETADASLISTEETADASLISTEEAPYTSLEEAEAKLTEIEQKRGALNRAMALIGVDGETVAPSAGAGERAATLGVLSDYRYTLVADPQNILLADYILENAPEGETELRRRAMLLKAETEKLSLIPREEYTDYNRLLSESMDAWHRAKEASDFSVFAPYLEKVIEYKRKFAAYTSPELPAYDALLNEYEEGLTTETLDALFEAIRAEIVPLLQKITACESVDISCLRQSYPVETQQLFSKYLMDTLGVDSERCTLAVSTHPFTEGLSSTDVRVTTFYRESEPEIAMYSLIHESGHAMYETDINDAYNDTYLSGGVSAGIHESQSRFYENIIGRSRAFINLVFPKLQELFPEQLKDTDAETFYRAVSRVEPSLVRTISDELTYPLHIMVRYEIERELVEGTLAVADVPARWNALFKEYFGIDVPDDAHGCLQDVHWSEGYFGYFPTYALGNAYAAQMLDVMQEELGDIFADIEKGDFSRIRGWLKENIHQYGSLYTPTELFERACGPLDVSHYTNYLKNKYSELYGLSDAG